MASAFRTESRSVQRFVGLPRCEKVRLWPTIAAILDTYRADTQEIADQVALNSLKEVMHGLISQDRFHELHGVLGKVLGLDAPAGNQTLGETVDFPDGAPLPIREAKKPGARATR